MKFLLLFLCLFNSCVDNKKQSANQIVARYGIEPELFWIIKYNVDCIENNRPHRSSTIYYDPISEKYYSATLEQTNNIRYDRKKIQDEKPYVEYYTWWREDPLTYIGSIDFYHRAYISTNNQQYLKTLSEIDTSYYINSDQEKILTADHPLTPILTNLYCHRRPEKEYQFTDGKTFYQITDEGFEDLFRDKEHYCGE